MLSLSCHCFLMFLYSSQSIDESLAEDPTIPRYDFGFAQQYKDYMNNLATQWNDVPAYVTQLINSVGQDLTTSGQMQDVVNSEWKPMYVVWANYLTQYRDTNAAWKYSISLAFDTTNNKRDLQLQKRSSCSLASGSLSVTGSQSATSAQASDTKSGTIKQPSTISGSAAYTTLPTNTINPTPVTVIPSTTTSAAFSCTSA